MNRMYDILDCERKMGGRTVQKYVETPLLTNHFRIRPYEPACKFDLRVWVLVTSFKPIKAHIYSRVYGRRCGQAYNYAASSIADTYTHLTNYSIQSKKTPFTLKSNAAAIEVRRDVVDTEGEENGVELAAQYKNQMGWGDEMHSKAPSNLFETIIREDRGLGGGGAAGKLRTTVRSERSRPASAGAVRKPVRSSPQVQQGSLPVTSAGTASELLLTFDELLVELAEADVNHNGHALWKNKIWPAIRKKVSSLLLMSAQHVKHRPHSFEFLGFDVLIDEQCEPWILEVATFSNAQSLIFSL